jgi:hypothetical protein
LRLLHHDLLLDLGVTVLVMLLHYGTCCRRHESVEIWRR